MPVRPRLPSTIALASSSSASAKMVSQIVRPHSRTAKSDANQDAGLRIEARPARTSGSLFGSVSGALLALRVDPLEIQRGDGKPGAGPRQHLREPLPHGQHNRRLAAHELARLIDCRLRVG